MKNCERKKYTKAVKNPKNFKRFRLDYGDCIKGIERQLVTLDLDNLSGQGARVAQWVRSRKLVHEWLGFETG